MSTRNNNYSTGRENKTKWEIMIMSDRDRIEYLVCGSYGERHNVANLFNFCRINKKYYGY